ncbi:hypothetical protein AtubIFM56815_007550 [Aspergillus tubingensis]|uniref:Uncharacterized protein n=2 Tax=Aspergillus subgen. Circumdati TaxID=2720871 RepID=A0A100IE91_ASPNG|nr:hypothetical protein ASPNIDRAFT_39746 [Aspergillus niger]GLA59446.1 hypothetical protein AtubIFM54640_010567 [Aspergillus tubingensis]GLA83358.1 hypothetical protein AtubIFM56815_007550 [Aspergillus tubingensis]GLA93734.1 hypothetical protein AtubIFM57143_011334 [Aspergillus tubingensis]GLB14002.1 hypothetical protein AtubIFM61612_001415 [Aspergillus tubingensis]
MPDPHPRYKLRGRNPVEKDVFGGLDKFLRKQRKTPRVKKPGTGGEAGKPRKGKRKGNQEASPGPSTTNWFKAKIHLTFIRDAQEESAQQPEEASAEGAADNPDNHRSTESEKDLIPGESLSDTHFYYQRTGSRRPGRSFVANVEVDEDVPVDKIFESKYLPSDDDTEYQRLVDLWQDPAVEDAREISDWSELEKLVDPKKARFAPFFRDVHDDSYGDKTTNILFDYMASLFEHVPSQGEIEFRQHCYFPLAREDLGKHQGLYFRHYIGKGTLNISGGQAIGVPLAICTVRLVLLVSRYLELNNLQCKLDLGRGGISQSEIPGLLFQANMAFEFESDHEEYPAYIISVRGWRFRFVKGIMTQQEVARFQDKKKRSGRIKVQRTGEYDIYDREERKEFIRVMLGLLRSFKDRREADFSTELP